MSSEEQAEFLTTQWMSVKQLEEAGIPSRKGPFTKREVERIDAAIQAYQEENEMDDERLEDLIHAIQPEKGFWTYIASAVPQRGVKSVYYHVRRSRNIHAKRGKWTLEEDESLRVAVRDHGNDWVTIADIVKRSPADCSDRFRQHLRYKGFKRKGAWSSEEEGQLLHAIEELARKGKTDMSARGFWVSVSNTMGATRTPKQCQSKWCVLSSHPARSCYLCSLAGLKHYKARSEIKARPGDGEKRITPFWSARLIHSTLSMKVTLTGSLSVIPLGTCGVVIASSKNGNL